MTPPPCECRPGHPSDVQLQRYVSGWLDQRAAAPIDDHLASCPRCCQRLDQLGDDGPWVERLRLAQSSLHTFETGRWIGDYRLVRVIGQGGMGIVYEAYQQSLHRRVALKVLPAANAYDSEAVKRFHREARAAAALHHTNIVPVYEIGESQDCQYFAMQLISGRSLAQLYRELCQGDDRPEDAEEALLAADLRARSIAHMGHQAASALAHAHARGVIHRDIKPSNLLLDDEGVLWVVDFGLAKIDGDDLTRSGQLVGTLRYLPPERFRGEIDERCDIYALGVTLYELLVRQRLFPSRGHPQSIDRILHHTPLAPRRIDASIPRDLETVVLKAIAKDPAQRYQTAAELADDLLRFYDSEAVLARRQGLHQRLPRLLLRSAASHRLGTAAIVLLALSALLAAGIAAHLGHENRHLAARLERLQQRSERQAERWQQQTVEQRQRLVASGLASAATALRGGQPLAALGPLCDAIEAEPDARAARLHRVRLSLILRGCPRPLYCWQLPEATADMTFDDPCRLKVTGRSGQQTVLAWTDGTSGSRTSPCWGEAPAAGPWPLADPWLRSQTVIQRVSGDGRLAAAGDETGRVRLWDRSPMWLTAEPRMNDQAAPLRQDGRLVSEPRRHPRQWQPLGRLHHGDRGELPLQQIAGGFAATLSLVATRRDDGEPGSWVQLWDRQLEAPLTQPIGMPTGAIDCACDGPVLVLLPECGGVYRMSIQPPQQSLSALRQVVALYCGYRPDDPQRVPLDVVRLRAIQTSLPDWLRGLPLATAGRSRPQP